MKLTLKTAPLPRVTAAILRNCLTTAGVPPECLIRKCRRDGLCAGPLIRAADDALHLVRADAADVASGDLAAPLCFMHLADAAQADVDQACAATLEVLREDADADIVETTRVLSARHWHRLKGGAS